MTIQKQSSLLLFPVLALFVSAIDLTGQVVPTVYPIDTAKPMELWSESDVVRAAGPIFIARFVVDFTTESKWKAGDRTVSISGTARLLGVGPAEFQAITDEAEAYARTRLGEVMTVIPDEKVRAAKKYGSISVDRPAAELGLEEKISKIWNAAAVYGGTKQRVFTAGGRPLTHSFAGHIRTLIPYMDMSGELGASALELEYHLEFAVSDANTSIATHYFDNNTTHTANLKLRPIIVPSVSDVRVATAKGAGGLLSAGRFVTVPDQSWIKAVREVPGGWEVEADPEAFKRDAGRVLHAHIDTLAAYMRAGRPAKK